MKGQGGQSVPTGCLHLFQQLVSGSHSLRQFSASSGSCKWLTGVLIRPLPAGPGRTCTLSFGGTTPSPMSRISSQERRSWGRKSPIRRLSRSVQVAAYEEVSRRRLGLCWAQAPGALAPEGVTPEELISTAASVLPLGSSVLISLSDSNRQAPSGNTRSLTGALQPHRRPALMPLRPLPGAEARAEPAALPGLLIYAAHGVGVGLQLSIQTALPVWQPTFLTSYVFH